ncbi:MAG: GNAT family N-acetyltransferase [Ruminococcaceae bacterium]|nr:GNAT family N-acetyltransferase [Oscillospiraceae bacterium]
MKIKVYKNGCPNEAKYVRQTVFVDEQKFVDEFDETDCTATHFVLFDGDKPIGCARAFFDKRENAYHIGRVAILKEYRGQHLGERIMLFAEEELKKQGADRVTLSAQVRASGFYKAIGYTPYGEEYFDQYCPHIAMEKRLS